MITWTYKTAKNILRNTGYDGQMQWGVLVRIIHTLIHIHTGLYEEENGRCVHILYRKV